MPYFVLLLLYMYVAGFLLSYLENIPARCIPYVTSFLTVPLMSCSAFDTFNGSSVFEILRLHVLKFKYFGHEGILLYSVPGMFYSQNLRFQYQATQKTKNFL